MKEEKSKLTIIIPCYNEEDNILNVYTRLVEVLDKTNYDYCLLFVNDGSTDNTQKILEKLHKQDKRVKVIELSRNFGKECALTAGLDYAEGNIVIPFDADLQDPPEVIIELLKKYEEGYEVVNAVRRERKGDGFLKRITAKLFYKLMKAISNIDIPENSSDFRLISGNALKAVRRLRERKRFMKGIFSWVGFKTANVYYDRQPRLSGKSKWNYCKLLELSIDGITSFSIVPLRLASLFGFIVSVIAFLLGLWIIFEKIFLEIPIPGYASIIVSVLFLGGIQLIFLGIIGEYIGRIYEEVKRRPIYIVRKFLNEVSEDEKDNKSEK